MQKYKVFLNEKRIIFRSGRNITLSKPSFGEVLAQGEPAMREWLRFFDESDHDEVVLEHENVDQLFHHFRACILNLDAAGGIVKKKDTLLFIFRNGKWDLPKGKVDKGETVEDAAIREIEEECGINGHLILKKLPSTYHMYQSPYKETKGRWIFKETFWFEMEYSGKQKGIPQLEEGITEVRWISRNEMDEVLNNTYDSLKELIQAYCD